MLGRTGPFGLYNKPAGCLGENIRKSLSGILREKNAAQNGCPRRAYPLKRLRNNLVSATSTDVIMQPVAAVVRHTEPNVLRHGKHAKQTVVWNPLWISAPPGAYYKAKRLSSLITDICLYYNQFSRDIARKLERLSIIIWNVSKRHFDGLVRSIRSTLWRTFEKVNAPVKSPEALEYLRILTRNPSYGRENRFNSKRMCRKCKDSGLTAQRSSHKVRVVRETYKCTKCTYPTCVGKWFTPQQN